LIVCPTSCLYFKDLFRDFHLLSYVLPVALRKSCIDNRERIQACRTL
jgi:hypothetical protein